MTATCPSCGSATPERARFCPECGSRLDPASAPEPPAEPSRLDELARSAELRLAGLRTRTRLFARSVGARQSARARVASLRARRARLGLERDAALHDLGAAVYAAAGPETESARAQVAALDAAIANLEDEMNAVLEQAEAQVAELDAELRPTVAVTRPDEPVYPDPDVSPAPAEEPWPPPDEADPPEPAVIPEPSPQPTPEPYPAP